MKKAKYIALLTVILVSLFFVAGVGAKKPTPTPQPYPVSIEGTVEILGDEAYPQPTIPPSLPDEFFLRVFEGEHFWYTWAGFLFKARVSTCDTEMCFVHYYFNDQEIALIQVRSIEPIPEVEGELFPRMEFGHDILPWGNAWVDFSSTDPQKRIAGFLKIFFSLIFK